MNKFYRQYDKVKIITYEETKIIWACIPRKRLTLLLVVEKIPLPEPGLVQILSHGICGLKVTYWYAHAKFTSIKRFGTHRYAR